MAASWVLLLAFLSSAYAFPTIYVARYAQGCLDHPIADFGKVHEYSKEVDKEAVFTLTNPATGKAVGGSICAGADYNLQLAFGGGSSVRNYLLTSSYGSLTADNNDCDAWCDNRVCSKSPVGKGQAVFKVPCDTAAGTQVSIKVTSANGRTPTPGSTLRSNTLNLSVEGNCPGKCSKASSSSSSAASKSAEGSSSSSSGNGSAASKSAEGSSSSSGSSGSSSSSSSSGSTGVAKGERKGGAMPANKAVSQKAGP